MASLELFEDYDRKTVHDIFSPDTPFHPKGGPWARQGIVRLPDRPLDFVLFVTFGQQHYAPEGTIGIEYYDEGITPEGVLSWESQPTHKLHHKTIRELISHDETQHNIYLFLRTTSKLPNGKARPYTYLGRLKYLTHDSSREEPVHFQWQLLDWDLEKVPLDRMGLELTSSDTAEAPTEPHEAQEPHELVQTAPPPAMPERQGVETNTFQTHKSPDYVGQDERNRKLGLAAEKAVVAWEQRRLREAGRPDLADTVEHVSVVQGDGAGHDIRSWALDGAPRYLEVKATRGGISSEFYLSRNEAAFSAEHADHYHLIRVYSFDPKTGAGRFYELQGDLQSICSLEPLQYRVRVTEPQGET